MAARSTRRKPLNEIDAVAVAIDPYFLYLGGGFCRQYRKRRNAEGRKRAKKIIETLDAFRAANKAPR